jgi:hypothetical protein
MHNHTYVLAKERGEAEEEEEEEQTDQQIRRFHSTEL